MSINLGPHLPDPLIEQLSGHGLREKLGLAYLLTSQDDRGYPHPCIISPGEIVAGGPSLLRLALAAESTSSRNLGSRSAATLCLAHAGASYYIKANAEGFPTRATALAGLAVFTLRPSAVLEDREPQAEVISGFRFRDLRGDEALLARWQPVVEALLATLKLAPNEP